MNWETVSTTLTHLDQHDWINDQISNIKPVDIKRTSTVLLKCVAYVRVVQ